MPDWEEQKDGLQKSFKFKDFTRAFAFMTRVAFKAEKLSHHPEWKNVYNQVDIKLTTHSAGNSVTQKDRELAAEIDKIYVEFTS